MPRVSGPPTAESSECRTGVEVPPPTKRWRAVNVRPLGIRFLKQWLRWADPSAVKSGFGYRVRARLASQRGFTLIEVLVSALITTLIATAVAGALITNTDIIANQNSRSQAETLAEQDQERLKGLSAEQLDNLSQSYNVTVGGATYAISSKAYYLSTSNGQSCTAAGGASATYFKTTSTVTRTNAQGQTATLATDESVITPPAGGSLLAQFHDQTASPLAGVTLAATGPDSDTGTSDTTGCVIFSALDSGTYNLTYTDVGFVDPNGNSSPLTDTATVASTGIAAPGRGNPIALGQAGGLTGNLKMTVGTPYTAYADGLSWFSSGGAGIPMASYRYNAQSLTSSISTTNTAGVSGTGLFPFVSSQNPVTYTNNYQMWAGTCRQEQPPTGYDMFTVSPGSTQTQNIQVPTLQLTVNKSSGSSTTPTDVKVIFSSSDGSCSDTWTMTPSNGTLITGSTISYYYGVPFASSATTGSTASASGQTGSLTVCADLKSGTNYFTKTSSAFTPSFSAATPVTVTLPSTSGSTKC
jgi:prepilin-type N-terminal cleavage/methylation domain-containing protein